MSILTTIVGIDPGKTGGIAAIYPQDGTVEKIVMPIPQALADMLENWGRKTTHVFLEKSQAMPKNGAVSMFNYGTGYGTIIGILIALRIPHTLVSPATWSKVMHAGTGAQKPKLRSLEACLRLFPEEDLRAPDTRSKKPHEGIVDALLIAEYGRRQLFQGGAGWQETASGLKTRQTS